MYKIETIQKGAADYLDAEFFPKLNKGGVEKILIATVISAVLKKSDAIVEKLSTNQILNMAEIVDTEGNIDLELIKNEFCEKIGSEGIKMNIPMVGEATFYRNDVEVLYNYIQRRA